MSPIIHEYTAEAGLGEPMTTRQARPSDSGNVGNSLSQLGNAAQNLNDAVLHREAQSEITDLDAKLASAHAQSTIDLDQRAKNADPNDKDFSSDFMDSYDDRMQTISDGISTPQGRQYFDRANALMRSNFLMHSVGKQAALAGAGAASDLQTSQDQYSASLYSDPSRLAEIKDLNSMGIEAKVQSGMISESQGEQFRAEADNKFTTAAIQGFTKINPQYVKEQLAKGTWDEDLNGSQKAELDGRADMAIKGQFVEQERIRTQRKQDLADQQGAQMKDALSAIYSPQGLSTKDVLDPNGKYGDLNFQQQHELLGMVEKASTEKIKTDPTVYKQLFDDIHNGKITDPNQLNSRFGNGIDMPTLQILRKEVEGRNTPDGLAEGKIKDAFLKNVEGQLVKGNPMMGIKDPEGEQHYADFLSDFLPSYTQKRNAGMTPAQLLNSNSPDYMGKMVAPHLRTQQEIMNSIYNVPQTPSAQVQGTPSGGGTTVSAPLGDISKMDLPSLQKLDPKALSPSDRQAAKLRWDQLNKK